MHSLCGRRPWSQWSRTAADGRGWPNRVHALNLQVRFTAGLRELYAIASGNLLPRPVQSTTADGRLALSPTMPLLGQRYQYLRVVSESDLSQVLVCTDTFRHCRETADGRRHPTVAIKVLNAQHWVLGAQEFERMRQLWLVLERLGATGARIIKPLHHFEEVVHFCIVFDVLAPLEAIATPPRAIHHMPLQLPSRQMGSTYEHGGENGLIYGSAGRSTYSTDIVTAEHHAAPRPCLSLNTLRQLTASMLGSLAALHEQGLLHADVKPDNILCDLSAATLTDSLDHRGEQASIGERRSAMGWLDDWGGSRAVLIDFSNAMESSACEKYFDTFEVQTLTYRAPEVLYGLPFDTKIDMWSLGVTLCELVGNCHLSHDPMQTFCADNQAPLLTLVS